MTDEDSSLIMSLINGHKDFRTHYYRNNTKLFKQLAKNADQPKYVVISCADSQVEPTLITNCAPTDLYTIKNLGSFVPPYDHNQKDLGMMAALDFALSKFHIQHIILLGHRHCQGVRALLDEEKLSPYFGFTESWFSQYESAKNTIQDAHTNLTLDEQCDIGEKLCLLISLKNLMSYSWIADRVNASELFIHAWYFDIEQGNIQYFDQNTAEFTLLENYLDQNSAESEFDTDVYDDSDTFQSSPQPPISE